MAGGSRVRRTSCVPDLDAMARYDLEVNIGLPLVRMNPPDIIGFTIEDRETLGLSRDTTGLPRDLDPIGLTLNLEEEAMDLLESSMTRTLLVPMAEGRRLRGLSRVTWRVT